MWIQFYCLLCVISQYQELRAGRGGARQNQPIAQVLHCVNMCVGVCVC